MRLEKKFITAIAATAAAVFSLGSAQAVEPIKMRWASDHSGPPHPYCPFLSIVQLNLTTFWPENSIT